MEVVGDGGENCGNDPHSSDPVRYVDPGISVAVVVREEVCMSARMTRRRGRFLRWFRRLLYLLVCEEAAAKGEAALWSPFKLCWCCNSAIMANSRYCSSCGVSQSGKSTGPITPVPPELSVTDRVQVARNLGERPVKAYNRLYGGGLVERKEKDENN